MPPFEISEIKDDRAEVRVFFFRHRHTEIEFEQIQRQRRQKNPPPSFIHLPIPPKEPFSGNLLFRTYPKVRHLHEPPLLLPSNKPNLKLND